MTRVAKSFLAVAVSAVVALVPTWKRQALAKCVGGVTNGSIAGGLGVGAHLHCRDWTPENRHDLGGGEWPQMRTIDCGPPTVRGRLLAAGDANCQEVRNNCAIANVKMIPMDPFLTTTGTLEKHATGAPWLLISNNCNARRARPQVTPWMVRDEIVKLLKPVPIGPAPPPGTSVLVNTQWIAWLPTAADKSLGTARMLGMYDVAMRIHVEHVDWDYGDGTTDASSTPGKVYDHVHDRCHTPMCPEYLGHVYRASGAFTAKAAVTWNGQYSVDGGRWQDIPGTVTPSQGPATLPVSVIEARSVLVPGPSPGSN